MTALARYLRLEAIGLWQESPDRPPREVVVAFGSTTLILTDLDEQPLGHWALAGVAPLGRTDGGIVYSMTADGAETLTIRDREMIEAIAAVTPRRRPPPPRRRRVPVGPILAALLLGALALAAPRLIRGEVARLVPPEKAAELGDRMLIALIEHHGPPCAGPHDERALAALATRLAPDDPPRLRVLDLGHSPAVALPGGTLILDRAALAARPEETAGWAALALERDPVAALVANAGVMASLGYLARGDFREAVLARAAEAPAPPPDATESARVRARLESAGIDPAAFPAAPPPPSTATVAERPRNTLRLPPLTDADRTALASICS